MNLSIRPATTDDFKSVISILQICQLAGPWLTEKLFRSLLDRNKGLYFVACIDDKVIGTIFATEDGGYCAYIYKLGVHPDFRQQGIGQKLIKAVVIELKNRGVDWSFAHVEKTNETSLNFFKKLGFSIRDTHYLLDNRDY